MGGLLAVYQSFFQPTQEKCLLPAIVAGMAGGHFPPPVVGISQALELRTHAGDVGIRPFGRMHAMLDGRVFGGQAEGVPADGMYDVIALHAAEAGHHIADGIVAHMPHVNIAGGVRKHFQHIILGLGRIRFHVEFAALRPAFLPLFFQGLGVVTGRESHAKSSSITLKNQKAWPSPNQFAARRNSPLSRALTTASRTPLTKVRDFSSPYWRSSSKASFKATLAGTSGR